LTIVLDWYSVKHHPQLVHRQNQQQQQQVYETNRVTGPVNGNECYFWRTTGCQFATGCRFRHVPEHKGIDRKPWQKMSKWNTVWCLFHGGCAIQYDLSPPSSPHTPFYLSMAIILEWFVWTLRTEIVLFVSKTLFHSMIRVNWSVSFA